jgi:hypothetical protein
MGEEYNSSSSADFVEKKEGYIRSSSLETNMTSSSFLRKDNLPSFKRICTPQTMRQRGLEMNVKIICKVVFKTAPPVSAGGHSFFGCHFPGEKGSFFVINSRQPSLSMEGSL